MRKSDFLAFLMIAASAAATCALADSHMKARGPEAAGKTMRLIDVGITTDRLKNESADGGFSAEVMARSGAVAALYNCLGDVERVAQQWATKNHVSLVERKNPNVGELQLAFASDKPSGFFVLDYRISPKLERARVTFTFRTLTNTEVSGDLVGLRGLGQQLFSAIQCVPQR